MDYYKKECGQLQKRLMENENIIKRMMYTNADLMGKLENSKLEAVRLKKENDSLNAMVQKLLNNGAQINTAKKPKTSEITATGHLVFGDPMLKVQESMKKKLDNAELNTLLQTTQEYLQLYVSKNNMLIQELHQKKEIMREMQKENENLKGQYAKTKAVELAAEKQAKFDSKMQRAVLRQLVFHAFEYLTVEDLLNVSLVCATFYSKCQELLGNNSTWYNGCLRGFDMKRNKLWSYYLTHQKPHAIAMPVKIKEKLLDPRKDSTEVPEEEVEAKVEAVRGTKVNNAGLFDCNYAAFENVEVAHPDTGSLLDYSLMNAEVGRFNPKEVFSVDFLAHFGVEMSTSSTDHEEIEEVISEAQQLFEVPYCTQGHAVVTCFLYVVMQRNRHKIYKMINALLEEPYHLKKLYSEDYYLLNLIIFQIDYLMKQKIPELYFHLKDENVMLHDFMVEWVLTLLSYQVFLLVLVNHRRKIIYLQKYQQRYGMGF
eukprot:TRINITY_DN2833_c0_g1_i1.p2 TRINITY_DN2833_c0_g1~~TRINITY_DN2833_c0_g1_i1.p2  ORF type:complete len:484 (+),score=69.09 TRINITY_DN2833_c0_g1_i1:3643-5094(+)